MARTTYRKAGKEKVEVNWTQFIDEMLSPDVPAHLGRTYSNFKAGSNGRGYSPLNTFWLYLQASRDPSVQWPVGPYGTWKDNGRQVKKGSKAKTVLKPVFAYKEDEKTGKKVKIGPVGFTPINTAFFFSDTDQADESGKDVGLVSFIRDWDLDRALEALKITKVAYDLPDGNTQGYSSERTYALNPVAAHPMKTLFHELGHIVLGHTTKESMEAYQEHRGIQEFQAEAVAYLLAHELGLEDWDPSESRAYVRGWLAGGEVPEKAIRQVFGAVGKILDAGYEAEESGSEIENTKGGQVASAA